MAAPFQKLRALHDPERRIVRLEMTHSGPRPNMSAQLLADFLAIPEWLRAASAAASEPVRWMAVSSALPAVYNLGGDLELFADLIRRRDVDAIQRYAHDACRASWLNSNGAGGLPLLTAAIVQGDALGGGFEAAVSANLLVVEKSARMGFPEIKFGLFPGMGATSYLVRRVGARTAQRLIASGETLTGTELHALGVVDILAEDGEGLRAFETHVDRTASKFHAHLALVRAQEITQPVSEAELRSVADLWVDAALKAQEVDLRLMERLALAQARFQARRGGAVAAA